MTAIIVQARMGSTRLPGKVLKTVLGKPLLEYQIERLRRVRGADALFIATTIQPQDDAVAETARRLNVPCHRGSVEDVLARYRDCARTTTPASVVRCTADCPLIDPSLIDDLIAGFRKRGERGYGTTEGYPRGLDAEIFTRVALEEAAAEATETYDREHVTPFLIRHPERFPPFVLGPAENLSGLRWTVDTPEDFELVRLILEELYPKNPLFSWRDVLTLVRSRPEWAGINAHIRQK